MRKNETEKKTAEYTSPYDFHGRIPLRQAIPLGMQHVLAMFVGNLTPLMIICGVCGISSSEPALYVTLLQNAMLAAGLITLIQLWSIGPVGGQVPVIMGTSSGFLGVMKGVAANPAMGGGIVAYSAIVGAAMVGGVCEAALGFFIKPLRKFFPPVVTGSVVLAIGLSLISVGVNSFAGGSGAKDFGSVPNLLLGLLVYVNWSKIAEAKWFSVPQLLPVKPAFNLHAILSILIMFLVTAVETIGDISGCVEGGMGREATAKELSGGVVCDGVGSVISSLFSSLPTTSFSQNVGLVTMTKVVNRMALTCGAVFLVLAGLSPKLAAVISIMPQSVLGGAAVMMFASIAVSGIKLLTKFGITNRVVTIVSIAMGLGFGLGATANALSGLPQAVQLIFGGSGIVPAAVLAIILNIAIPKEQEDLDNEARANGTGA